MKKVKLVALLLVLCMCFTLFAACEDPDPCKNGHSWVNGQCSNCGVSQCDTEGHDYGDDGVCKICGASQCASGHKWVNAVCSVCGAKYELTDYVSELKLNMSSGSAKYTNSKILNQYVDGDTTHFNVPRTVDESGILKARYLAVNTPESTGKIEPYGKVASDFTHKTLQDALDNGGSILLESDTDDGVWNHDSYGRTLVWVWYKPSATAEYRNLNLELLQNGLAYGSASGNNRYGDTCSAALNQAVTAKLVVHSGLKDDNFYYGDAIEMNLKQLRTNLETYAGKKVAFNGTVTSISSGGCYLEDYDEDTGVAYGIYAYFGASPDATVAEIMGKPGNRVRVVGVLSKYNESWQVSDLTYRMSRPDDPSNVQLLEEGSEIRYQKLTVPEFFGEKTITVYREDLKESLEQTFKMCALVLNTTISFDNLTVTSSYTTSNGGSSDGAFTLYCKDAQGNEITIRTGVIYKEVNGKKEKVKASEFEGKTISVKGIVDFYSDQNLYQIKVLRYTDITVG